jgi:hypothetical protein
VVALGVLAWRAAHRPGSAVPGGLVVVLASIPLTVVTVNRAPLAIADTLPYVRYVWIVATVATVVVAVAVVEELRARGVPAALRRRALVVPAVLASVAGLLALPYADHSATAPARAVAATDQLAAGVVPQLEGRGPVLVQLTAPLTLASWVGPGLMVKLQEAGIPFVVDTPELRRQLGRRRSDVGRAEVQLVVWTDPDASPGPDARLLADVDGLTPGQEDELAALERRVHRAVGEAGGLPIDPGWEEHLDTEPADRLRPVVEDVAALDDPDDLLASPELLRLLGVWLLAFDDLDGLVAPDRFPVDDLERWYGLADLATNGYVAAYLMPL